MLSKKKPQSKAGQEFLIDLETASAQPTPAGVRPFIKKHWKPITAVICAAAVAAAVLVPKNSAKPAAASAQYVETRPEKRNIVNSYSADGTITAADTYTVKPMVKGTVLTADFDHVKSHLQEGQMNYLFFDEIQMVPNFQKVINSLFLLDNVDIYVTGSNAYLLSGEIATLLTGRYIEIHLLPFSFSEYLLAQPTPVSTEEAYREYIEFGAFPYVVQIKDNAEMVREYLNGLYNTIVLKDVVDRKKIADTMILQSIVRFLADNIGNLSVIKRISDTMTSVGRKITSHTVENYIGALLDCYIFYSVPRYDAKGKQLGLSLKF